LDLVPAALPADAGRPADGAPPDGVAPVPDNPAPAVPDENAVASPPAGPGRDDGWFTVLGDGWALPAASDGTAPDADAEDFQAAVQAVFAGQE
jgi:hypothetical protein